MLSPTFRQLRLVVITITVSLLCSLLPAYVFAAPGDYYDSDGDGLSDETEILLGTNPYDPRDGQDSDGDGLIDSDELLIGTNPNRSDRDYDSDLLSDLDEGYYGTNPYVMDSDGDWIWDGVEVACGTSPTNPYSYDTVCEAQLLGNYIEIMGGTASSLDIWLDPSTFCNPYDPNQDCN